MNSIWALSINYIFEDNLDMKNKMKWKHAYTATQIEIVRDVHWFASVHNNQRFVSWIGIDSTCKRASERERRNSEQQVWRQYHINTPVCMVTPLSTQRASSGKIPVNMLTSS